MKTNQIIKGIIRKKTSSIFFFSIILLVSIFTIQSCEKEEVIESKNTVTNLEISKSTSTGHLQSTTGAPISDVILKLGQQIIATSNEKGNFTIDRTNYESGTVLTVKHPDFVTLYKIIEKDSELFFLMKERVETHRINPTSRVEIPVGPGGQITIPPNAFSNNGNPFNGDVDIRATYIDVTNDSELEAAPGAYIAENNLGNALYPLESFGMMEIVATVAGTNTPLDLSAGKAIKASFPILDEDTPEKVNLYELNQITGYWSPSGVLNTINGTLQGWITSINNGYNADKPCANELVCIKIKIEYKNGDPGCGISLKGLSYRGFDGPNIPNKNGYVYFWVCPYAAFELRACRSSDPAFNTTFDLSTILMNPSGCTDLGVWTIDN